MPYGRRKPSVGANSHPVGAEQQNEDSLLPPTDLLNADETAALIARIMHWSELPNDGDPLLDAILEDIVPAAVALKAASDKVEQLVATLRPFADALTKAARDLSIDPVKLYETANCLHGYLKMDYFAAARDVIAEHDQVLQPSVAVDEPS
jgi:hypothetical protein